MMGKLGLGARQNPVKRPPRRKPRLARSFSDRASNNTRVQMADGWWDTCAAHKPLLSNWRSIRWPQATNLEFKELQPVSLVSEGQISSGWVT